MILRRIAAVMTFYAGLLVAPAISQNAMPVQVNDPVKIAQEKKVAQFLGSLRIVDSCMVQTRHLLRDYVLERVQLPDDPFGIDVGKGRKLYSGGRAHDYGDSGAYILDEKGQVAAVAVMGCSLQKTPGGRPSRWSIEIYVRDDAGQGDDIAAFKRWRGYKEVRELNREQADALPNIHPVRQGK